MGRFLPSLAQQNRFGFCVWGGSENVFFVATAERIKACLSGHYAHLLQETGILTC